MDKKGINAAAKTIVKECQTEEHSFTCDKTVEENICWQIHADAVLRDIKYLLKEYYVATFFDDGSTLKLKFTNGQKFSIAVKEC